ncbi:hypothetical protein [Silanimonas sp.]|jgi:hypothetical protein|uniref:hypothetical protein n=1 Tax=Silanimonas sp. TaxID=1929290 RepID=UPI0037C6FBDB
MSALKVLRATTTWGDAAWALSLAGMGALIGFIGALASDDATLGAVSARTLPLVGLPLMFRYQFSSARSVLFWFDASRQAVPGVTSSSLVAEALRFSTFLAVLFGAMGIASWLAPGVVSSVVVAKTLAVAMVASSIGALAAVMPYRWMPVMMLLPIGLVVVVSADSFSRMDADALQVAVPIVGLALVLMFRRLRSLRRAGVDPAVGGDYAFVFSFGRHTGSPFDAPNSAPLAVLLQARRQRARPANPTLDRLDADARVRALLGEQAWRQVADPARHWLKWAGVMLGWPMLMLGFFTVMYTLSPGKRTLSEMLVLLLVMLLVLWGFVMNGALQAGYARRLASELRETGALHAEVRLLPGVAAGYAAWRRRLRPLWLPQSLGMMLLVLGTTAFAGVAPLGLGILAAVGLLEALRMRTSTHGLMLGSKAAQRFSDAAGVATGLALVYGPMVWMQGISSHFDKLFGQFFHFIRVDPILPVMALLALLAIAAVLLGIAAVRLHGEHDNALIRGLMPRSA